MAKRFVFLEINDPEITSLVSGLRELATGSRPRSNVHITVRGPYNREIPRRQIVQYQHAMLADPVLLHDVGIFQTGDRHVAFLRVDHPGLRKIWWKPDFPVSRFGFNPHVTIYEGADVTRARLVATFLRNEALKLLTWKFCVTLHVADHEDLFATPPRHRDQQPFLGLVNNGLVRADILLRFARALRAPEHAERGTVATHPA